HSDLTSHSGRIASPIAHRRLSREELAAVCGCSVRNGGTETDGDENRAENKIIAVTVLHSRFQSLRIERSRGSGRSVGEAVDVFSAPKARHSFGSLGRRPMENSSSQNAALK